MQPKLRDDLKVVSHRLLSRARVLFATQNKLSKLFIDPEVDEEVSKVVDVDQVEEVWRHGQLRVCFQNERRVGDDSKNEETGSNLHRFSVTPSLVGVSAQDKGKTKCLLHRHMNRHRSTKRYVLDELGDI